MLAGALQFHLASIPAQRRCPDCRYGDLQQCPAFPLKYCLDRYVVLIALAHIPSFLRRLAGGAAPVWPQRMRGPRQGPPARPEGVEEPLRGEALGLFPTEAISLHARRMPLS